MHSYLVLTVQVDVDGAKIFDCGVLAVFASSVKTAFTILEKNAYNEVI